MNERLVVVEGDITTLQVDAIVNAANSSLLGATVIAVMSLLVPPVLAVLFSMIATVVATGAIHEDGLADTIDGLGGAETGAAKITKGYRLPARWVIHTVGPVWNGGGHAEDALLAGCYQHSFAYVPQYDIKTIAFPAISTGAYGFPRERATRIAVREMLRALAQYPMIEKVYAVCFGDIAYQTYVQVAAELERNA